MLTVLQLILLILIVGSGVFYLACTVLTQRFFATSAPPRQTTYLHPAEAGVSLLVSVCGIDAHAWENWSSLCQQNYGVYEVLFGVADPTDPAIAILKKLAEIFPDRVRLFIGLELRGVNRKDSTLSHLLEAAQFDTIVFVDSDIQVSPDYLYRVTQPLADPKVGMVTCAFVGRHPKFLGAALASLGRCCDFIPSALVAHTLDGGLRFAIGATIAMRRSVLTEVGGLHFNRIGSDYNLGKRTAQAGYRVEFSHYLLESDTGAESIRQLMQREVRWARTIRFNRGAIYYTMIFCYGSVFWVPFLILARWQPWAIAVVLVTLALRYVQAISAIINLGCPNLLRWLWLLSLRDLLSLEVWLIGAFGNKIYWRGQCFRIQGDGVITPWR